MSAPKDALASPPRVATQESELGNLVRAAIRYTPALDQASAFRALVERESAGTRARRTKLALSLAFASLALAALMAGWVRTRHSGAPVVAETSSGTRATPRPTPLAPGNTRLDDGTLVHVAARSSALVEATTSGPRIALESGEVTLDVARQNSGRRLEVRSGRYRFVVLGTAFTVASSPERVTASVREGRVAVLRDQEHLAVLAAGDSWTSDASPATAASTAPSAPPAPADVAVPSPAAEPDARGASEPQRSGDDRDCLAFARGGRARDAERCFVDQAAGGGLRAELALSELARLRSDVLGDPNGALQALERYRARFPSGSLRAEVDLSYVHLLARVGRSRDVLAESERLLDSGSARERAGELRMLRGNTLLTALSSFAAAEREYAAVERGGGKFAGEAAYHRGLCFEGLGDARAAAEAYRRYLHVPGRPREADARRRLLAAEASSQ